MYFNTPNIIEWLTLYYIELHYINYNIQDSRIQQLSTMCSWFDFLKLTVLPELVSDYPSQSVGWIIYPFININSAAVDVWELIHNSIAHFTGHVIMITTIDYTRAVSMTSPWLTIRVRDTITTTGMYAFRNLIGGDWAWTSEFRFIKDHLVSTLTMLFQG